MKKLMIGMLAAGAAIASAWAQNDAESTFSSEKFNGTAPVFTTAPWSYSAESVGDGELTITTGGATADGKFLELNTASKKLSLAPTSAGAYTVAEEEEVYFDSYVKFDAASDTIPEVDVENDKLALFVLDNTDYVESDPTTALYVLGGYMNGDTLEKRLYKLNTIVDAQFLAGFQHISIKMYSNVMPTGTTAIPGFLVKVGDAIATVAAAYTTDANGEWNLVNNVRGNLGEYLGATIDSAVAASRYNGDKGQLILGLKKADSTLNAVDFMGKGGIDDLAFTNVKDSYGFDADAQLFMIDSVTGVESVKDSDGKVVTQLIADGSTTNLTVVLANGYYYGGATGTVTINVTLTAGGKLSDVMNSNNLFPPVAIVGSTQYKDAAAFATAADVQQGKALSGDIKLLDDISAADKYVGMSSATLDLNGKTLTVAAIAVQGDLTINDTAGNGKVVGTVSGTTAAIINAGTFDGQVLVASIPVTSTAKFLATANTAATLEGMLTSQEEGFTYSFADGDWDGDGNLDGYLMIVATAVSNNDVTVKGEIATGDQATADANVAEIEAELDANGATEDAKAWVEKIYGVEGVPAADLVGAQNIDISVKFDLPLMRNTPEITVEASTVETPAEGQAVAAFEFTITDGDNVVDPTTAAAKVINMVQYVESLTGTWTGATPADVDTKITSSKKIKVQLKKKEGKSCGFMKLKLK